MFVALLLLNIVHPGLVLKGPESSYPSRRWWKRGKAEGKTSSAGSAFEPLTSRSFELASRRGGVP
jgi:hypothetical protein